jgi:hypothetical protein
MTFLPHAPLTSKHPATLVPYLLTSTTLTTASLSLLNATPLYKISSPFPLWRWNSAHPPKLHATSMSTRPTRTQRLLSVLRKSSVSLPTRRWLLKSAPPGCRCEKSPLPLTPYPISLPLTLNALTYPFSAIPNYPNPLPNCLHNSRFFLPSPYQHRRRTLHTRTLNLSLLTILARAVAVDRVVDVLEVHVL